MDISINKEYIANEIVDKLAVEKEKCSILTKKIYQLELESRILFKYSTYRSRFFRCSNFLDVNEREKLNGQILNELISYTIFNNENDICLGKGGCKPQRITKNSFFQIIGLPGAGKTYIANIISKQYGAYLIDSDFAKRKFPEYNLYTCSSSLLHEEANEISYSLTTNSIFEYCLNHGYSMVIPRIGHLYDSLIDTLKLVKGYGYHIYLILVEISITESIKSCYERYCENGRYIPLTKVLNECGSLPKANYNLIKNSEYISGFALINTDLLRQYSIRESFCSI